MAGSPSIRSARPADAAAVAEIHNQGIAERQATFETTVQTEDGVAEVSAASEHPFLVAEDEGRVVGWGRLAPFVAKSYYAGVLEVSVYVHRDARARGVGSVLLVALARAAAECGAWKVVALLFPGNTASVAMFGRAGYREVGVFHRHGRLDGEWRDVVVFERGLEEAGA